MTYLKINEKYRALFGDEKKPDEINPKEKESMAHKYAMQNSIDE